MGRKMTSDIAEDITKIKSFYLTMATDIRLGGVIGGWPGYEPLNYWLARQALAIAFVYKHSLHCARCLWQAVDECP